MSTRTKKAAEPIADICLYGNYLIGAGYIASAAGKLFGDGNPVTGRSMTEAMWLAGAALQAAGCNGSGSVRIFAPGGERMAVARLDSLPYFGSLSWGPAPVLTIKVADILAVAEK
jgi:hypothetical protein